MKITLIYLILSFTALACFARELDTNKLDKKGLIYLYEGKPINGKVTIKEEPLIMEFNLKDGLQNGLQKEYLLVKDKKFLWLSLHAKDGFFHGEMKKFWKNGQLRQVKNYDHGKIVGESKEWSENGVLKTKYIFIDGWDHHKQLTYDNSGKVTREIIIKNKEIISDSNSPDAKQDNNENSNDPFSSNPFSKDSKEKKKIKQ